MWVVGSGLWVVGPELTLPIGTNTPSSLKTPIFNDLRRVGVFTAASLPLPKPLVGVFSDTLQYVTDMGGVTYFESNRRLPVKQAIISISADSQ